MPPLDAGKTATRSGACDDSRGSGVAAFSAPGNKIIDFGDVPVDLLFVFLFFLAIIVGAGIVYYRMSGSYEVKVVALRKKIDALEVENRKIKHEVSVLTEKNQALMDLREKELEREKAAQAENAPINLENLDPKDVMAELLRSNAITVADIEKINKYKRDTKSDVPVEELLIILDMINQETLTRAKRSAARRSAKTAA